MQNLRTAKQRGWLRGAAAIMALCVAARAFGDGAPDPLLDLMLSKGMITADEAHKVRAEADAIQKTNGNIGMLPPDSKWKIGDGIKNIELFGDLRLRYEHRQANTPANERLGLERGRYSLRLGFRGDAFDQFYYGFRLDTSSNPRSAWATFGTSSSGTTYNGPFGKSTAGIGVGQIYLGWRPESWVDITVGKMPNPLFTTPMVWDPDLNPEGAAERLKYKVGEVQFFATFGQFLYQDYNPAFASGGLGFNTTFGQSGNSVYQLAWQAGLTWDITTNISVKAAGTLYNYIGLAAMGGSLSGTDTSPYFNGPYVGEGQFTGGAGVPNGASGSGTSSVLPAIPSLGFPLNQVGLNHLNVIEIPFQVNFKYPQIEFRLFGDLAYNLDGRQRAADAAAGYAYYLGNTLGSSIKPFSAQKNDVHAYQVGLAVASPNSLDLVNGINAKKHSWEVRTYWQHVEQYSLDPNLVDSDFFEGRENLEGIYAAFAYALANNFIGTVRYGYASRINGNLGTGGSNQDIPQVNPVNRYNILQLDLAFRF